MLLPRPAARGCVAALVLALGTGCAAVGPVTSDAAPAAGRAASPAAAAPTAGASPTTTATAPTPTGPLAGRTVVLDPGHNGGNASHPEIINRLVDAGGMRKACNTTGTATNAGYAEHAYTWDVARRAAALLRARGATVVLTRRSDSGVGPCIDRRARIANRAHADAVVSIHADGARARDRGFHVIRPGLAPDAGNRRILRPSRDLALAVRRGFSRWTGEPFADYVGRRGLDRRSDLGGLNLSRVPAVFIESANMRNADDAARLSSPRWRQRAAVGIAGGVNRFLTRR